MPDETPELNLPEPLDPRQRRKPPRHLYAPPEPRATFSDLFEKDPSPPPRAQSREPSDHLLAIRILLTILVAGLGLLILFMGLHKSDPQVCVYYTDGTSTCK